jgi:hypothetical protein
MIGHESKSKHAGVYISPRGAKAPSAALSTTALPATIRAQLRDSPTEADLQVRSVLEGDGARLGALVNAETAPSSDADNSTARTIGMGPAALAIFAVAAAVMVAVRPRCVRTEQYTADDLELLEDGAASNNMSWDDNIQGRFASLVNPTAGEDQLSMASGHRAAVSGDSAPPRSNPLYICDDVLDAAGGFATCDPFQVSSKDYILHECDITDADSFNQHTATNQH